MGLVVTVPSQRRNDNLEGIRGIAAIIVVVFHSTLAFMPQLSGIFSNFPFEQSIVGKPYFFIMNGPGAVVLFFVLSGFVLSRSFFLNVSYRAAALLALRRWPRLALPVTISTLVSWALFHFELYGYEAAGSVTKSPWLSHFAGAYESPFQINFLEALKQGLWRTFLFGESYYNSSLWTMNVEFVGSFLVFASMISVPWLTKISRILTIFSFIILSYFVWLYQIWLITFLIGMALSFILPNDKKKKQIIFQRG